MTLDEVVDRLNAQGPAWLWFATSMRNGDVFHAVAFIEAFRREHGYDLPIRLIVNTPAQAKICSIFEGGFQSIDVQPEVTPTASEWIEFFLRRQLPPFGPNVPIVIHPHCNIRTSLLNLFFAQNRIVWGQLYKSALDLPPDVEPAAPPLNAGRTARAIDLLAANEMPRGRSMILFPYAQSFPVPCDAHFAGLAKEAMLQGWEVFTSIASGEQAITGTRPVFLPFDILLEVAEEAGWVVAVRSGICDLTAAARCRKTFIFRSRADLGTWGVDVLELARDTYQLVFPFETYGPPTFCKRVFGLDNDGPTVPRRVLSERVVEGLGRPDAETYDLVDVQRGSTVARRSRRVFGRGRARVVRLVNLPPRSHPRLADIATAEIDGFIAQADANTKIYACRDSIMGLDYLEEVDPDAIHASRYAAAGSWHTLVSCRDDLQTTLPVLLQTRVLSRNPMPFDLYNNIGQAFYSAPQMVLLNGDQPLDLGGLQFLSGWHGLEPWGIWSAGEVSVLKLTLGDRPASPVVLELDVMLLVTQVDGELKLSVEVNGLDVLTVSTRQEDRRRLRIIMPAEILGNATAYVKLYHPGARSPLRIGTGSDPRRMAVGLMGAMITSLESDDGVRSPVGPTRRRRRELQAGSNSRLNSGA